MEVWARFSSPIAGGNYPSLFALGQNGSGEEVAFYFDGDLQAIGLTTSGLGAIYTLSTPQTNTSYHLVGTYDGATVKFYVNGVLQGQHTVTLAVTYGVAQLGVDINATYFWPATLDEAALYSYVLTSTQIQAHYAAGVRPRDVVPVTMLGRDGVKMNAATRGQVAS
jgi:hypothetical protein